MSKNKRRLRGVCTGLLASAVLTACGGSAPEAQESADGDAYPVDCSKIDLTSPPASPAKLRFAHGTAAEEPIYLMEGNLTPQSHRGTWYEPEYSTIASSTDRLTSIQAGQVDGASMSTMPLIVAKSKGVDFSLVTSVSQEAEGHFLSTFVALESSGIDSLEDIRGKTIGLPDYGTAHDYWARKAVASVGLDPDKDVKYALVPLPTTEEALRQGTIDLAGLVEPFYSMAQKRGGLVEVFNSLTGSGVTQELQDTIFSNEFIEANPGAVCAWIADFQQSVEAYNADVKGSKQALLDAKLVAASADDYLNADDWARPADGLINLADLDTLIESLKELDILDGDAKVTGAEMVYPNISAVE